MKSLNTLIGVLFCLLIVVALMSGSEVNLAGSAESQAGYGGMPLDQMKKLSYDRRIVLADGFTVDNSNRLQCLHYEENGFCKADAISKPYQTLGSSLLSATSPHFMPAMEYTAGILKTMALEGGWDTIFVIGPNHGALGFPVTVSYADWGTPFGTLEMDEEALDMLMRSRQLKSSAGVDERIMEQDHSVSTQMPFIQHYLPGVQVVPLLLSKAALPEDLDAVAEVIFEVSKKKKIFLLCSVDFSHYESIEKIPGYDKETEAIIQDEDIWRLKSLSNAYFDSPEVLYVFMRYASYYPDRMLERLDGKILPESEMNRAVGYSYHTYAYSYDARDTEPPVITGVEDNKSYQLGQGIAYRNGVTVTDNRDKVVELLVDSSKVDIDTPGVYPVTYSATDLSGNTTSITVNVRILDVDEDLVYTKADNILGTILTDNMTQREKANAIYNWVKGNLVYAEGTDKTSLMKSAYAAFSVGRGDCFVYYAAGELLLSRAGLENMYVESSPGVDISHYWSLVRIDGKWYHFDTCPLPSTVTIDTFLFTDNQAGNYTKIIEKATGLTGYYDYFNKGNYPKVVQ